MLTVFSDDFNRANGPLGSNWTLLAPSNSLHVHGTVGIVSDQLSATEHAGATVTEDPVCYATALSIDQWVQVTYISGSSIMLDIRIDPTTNKPSIDLVGQMWELQIYAGGTTWSIYDACGYYLVQSTSSGASALPHVLTNGDVVFFGAQGSTFTLQFNGATLYSGPMLVNTPGAPANPIQPSSASTCGACNPVWYAGLRFMDPSAPPGASIVVDNFSCGTYGAAATAACQPATLATAIADLCLRAGLVASEIDTSLLTGSNVQPVQALRGYVVERPTTAAECLQEIMRAYFIDACETGGTVRFVPRGMVPSPPTVPEGDLGLLEDKAKLTEQQSQAEDLPVSTTVLYNDALVNYQQGKQIKQRNPRILTVATRNQTVLSLPFTLLPDEARQIAEADLYSKWCNRLSYKMNLWRASWALLDPCDTVKFIYEGKTFNMRLLSVQVGQNLTAALEGVLEDYRNYNSIISGSASSGSGTMATDPGGGVSTGSGATGVGPPALAPTMLWLLDIPYLQDADAKPGSSGFYAVFSSGTANWAGATLYESHDDASFDAIGGVKLGASFGYPSAALAAPTSPWAWDTTNTLTIQMVNGSLAGSTDAAVLAGGNGLVIGQEILQFVNCTDNGSGSFTISRLLRGRRGTDNCCGSHTAGEVAFAPLAGGFLHQLEPVSHIGQLWYYRGVTSGGNVASASDVTLTLAGNDLKPYSVVHIGGMLDGSNNWTITWTRRTRAGGSYGTGADNLIDGMNGPLNEQTEAYQVDVMSGSTVKRTISTNVTTAVYTAAQQVADFGAVQSTLTVNIYQMSATVGRGFKATATLPVSGGAPPVSGGLGEIYVN